MMMDIATQKISAYIMRECDDEKKKYIALMECVLESGSDDGPKNF
jgi:hypothetical protein